MGVEPKLDLRVLVVDDEADSRELLALVLERQVRRVEVAASAREAFDRIVAEPPDMLLSDISMPGEDGWSLVRRVRALPRDQGGAMPALAVTALATDADRARSHEAGFDFVLYKPLHPQDLADAVRAAARARDAALPLARRLRLLAATSQARIVRALTYDRGARAAVARGLQIARRAEKCVFLSHQILARR